MPFPPSATYRLPSRPNFRPRGLSSPRRRGLHACLVEALEALAPERLAEHVERLAHHALWGEVWDKAVTYCRQAGARAYGHAAFREEMTSFEQALQALAHLPEDSDTRVLAIEIRLALAGALQTQGEYGRYRALLGEAAPLARALDDRARLGWVLASIASVLWITGDHDGAMVAGQQALVLAATLGESALQAQASLTLRLVYHTVGNFGGAAELLRRSMEVADREAGTPRTDVRIRSRAFLARTLGALGAFAEGQRHGEEALPPRHAGRPWAHTAHCPRMPWLPVSHPGGPGARHSGVRPGPALCRASGNQTVLRGIAGGLGCASALQGRLAEGCTLLEETISEGIRIGAMANHPYRVAWLSEVYRLAGRGEEAWQHAHQALDLARQFKARGDEALALHQLGVVQAHAGPPAAEQAEAYYQQALALAEDLGMRPLQAHCHRDLGTLYARIGRREQARTELVTAIGIYCAMDMTFWLPQAEAVLAQTGWAEGPEGGLP
jgi:tetratricopeptide (TPR) repeat protein